jgi:hypothetical protein
VISRRLHKIGTNVSEKNVAIFFHSEDTYMKDHVEWNVGAKFRRKRLHLPLFFKKSINFLSDIQWAVSFLQH